MPTVNLKIELLDKKQSYPLKAKYDTETRIAQAQRGLRKIVATKFLIDPDHIRQEIANNGKIIQLKVYVDNATRKSIPMTQEDQGDSDELPESIEENNQTVPASIEVKTSNKTIDGKTKNMLDYLIEERFWKSLIAKTKLPLSTVILLLFSGGGIFYLIKDIILPIFGVQ
jgi:hypothetical protein